MRSGNGGGGRGCRGSSGGFEAAWTASFVGRTGSFGSRSLRSQDVSRSAPSKTPQRSEQDATALPRNIPPIFSHCCAAADHGSRWEDWMKLDRGLDPVRPCTPFVINTQVRHIVVIRSTRRGNLP